MLLRAEKRLPEFAPPVSIGNMKALTVLLVALASNCAWRANPCEYCAAAMTLLGGTAQIAPQSIANRRAHFKADGTVTIATGVSQWADESGNGFAATQGTAANQPTFLALDSRFNNRPSLGFDGVNDMMTFNRPIADDFSMVIVFRSTQGFGTAGHWYSAASLVDGDAAGTANDFGSGLLQNGRIAVGTAQAGIADISIWSNTGFNDGLAHLVVWTRKKATTMVLLYVDGSLQDQGPGSPNSLTASATVGIGRGPAGGSFLLGSIAEIVIYDAVISEEARAGLECYLSVKYGMSIVRRCLP